LKNRRRGQCHLISPLTLGPEKTPMWFWSEMLHLYHSRFYETPFPHSQNCVAFSYTIQNKSEKKYSCYDNAYMYLTVKNLNQIYSSWNHIYSCFNEILQTKFLQYIFFFRSRDVLNQFQLRACNVYRPLPPPNFYTDLAFLRERFLWRLGGGQSPPPPLAPLGYATELKSCAQSWKEISLNIITENYIIYIKIN
jgi:hypothetical protein